MRELGDGSLGKSAIHASLVTCVQSLGLKKTLDALVYL